MASLFLSYAHDDVDRVEPLAAALEREGHAVWWDRHISGGQEFAEAIELALDSADVVIVCWTSKSVRSPWVRDEAGAGRDSGRLVPVTLDGCQPPLGFRQYQTINLARWDGQRSARGFNLLACAVAERSNPAAASHAPISASRSVRRFPLSPFRWASLAAAAVLLVGGAFLYTRAAADSGRVEPKVAIGQFTVGSPATPRELPGMLGHEIVAAFGAENAVSVIAPSNQAATKSAPFLMDGAVNRQGAGVRFTVSLRNQKSGVILWSGSYEHEAADAVAARQAAVGESQVVRCGLWGASSYPIEVPDEALALYLKWCHEHWSGSANPTAELDAARRVTVALPNFSFGWSALALAAVPLAAEQSAEAARIRAEAAAAARRSMTLDGQNPEGYMALAGLVPLNRFGERESLLKKALSVRPTECGCERQAYGDFLASVGRMEEAVAEFERARDMRPLAPFSNLRFAQALYIVGRNDEADQVLHSTLELWPAATSLRLLKIKSALWTKRYDDATDELKRPDLPLTTTQRTALARAFAALKSADRGQMAKALETIESLAADARYNDQVIVATLAAMGAQSAALQAAANLIRTRGLFDAEVLFEPNLAQARDDAGYANLVRALGLVDYWRAAPSQPDVCREAAKPGFCSIA